jgi:hypothetical protein
MSDPYYPAIVEYPEAKVVEFVLRDTFTIYDHGPDYDTIRDAAGEVIGFAWPLGSNPAIAPGRHPEAGERERAQRETAWLIENSDGGSPVYWSLTLDEEAPGWTHDAGKALRFARAEDAQAYIDDIGWTEPRPVEHEWVGPPRALASPSGEKEPGK